MRKSNTSKRNIQFVLFRSECFYLIMQMGAESTETALSLGDGIFSGKSMGMIYLKSSRSIWNSRQRNVNKNKKTLRAHRSAHPFVPLLFLHFCLFMHMSDMSCRITYCNFIYAHCFLSLSLSRQILSVRFMCAMLFHDIIPLSCCFFLYFFTLSSALFLFHIATNKRSEDAYHNWDNVSKKFHLLTWK